MNVEMDGAVRVTLSERNLRDLMQQASDGTNPFVDNVNVKAQLIRRCATPNGDVVLLVQVEDDAMHYGDRTPGPGGLA
jgi:hypothetical protein